MLATQAATVLHADSLVAKTVSKKTPASKLKVVTTLPVLRSLAEEIGKDLVSVTSLSTASEDPHFIREKPTFKKLVQEADVFILVGRSLELWTTLVLSSAQNPKLSGGPASRGAVITASNAVYSLDVPKSLSRAEHGDVHPHGNPHIWLSPLAALQMAGNIKDGFIKVDAAHKETYEKNFTAFKALLTQKMFGAELTTAVGTGGDLLWRLHGGRQLGGFLAERKKSVGGWLKTAQGIDYPFFTYHEDLGYLAHEFGLKILGQIEEKPGIPPSTRYQNTLKALAAKEGVRRIVSASYYAGSKGLIDKLAKDIQGRSMFIDIDCQTKNGKLESYVEMMDRLLKALVDFKPPATNKPSVPTKQSGG